MSAQRMFGVVVVLSLAIALFFTLRVAASTRALVEADRSYSEVESLRAHKGLVTASGEDGNIDSATQSYIAWARAIEEQNLALAGVDHSYEEVEAIRARRLVP